MAGSAKGRLGRLENLGNIGKLGITLKLLKLLKLPIKKSPISQKQKNPAPKFGAGFLITSYGLLFSSWVENSIVITLQPLYYIVVESSVIDNQVRNIALIT